MKIFYYFLELDTPMYKWQRTHFLDELERNGHNLITYNPLDFQSMDEANEKVVDIIRGNGRIDLFLTCDESAIIYKETIEQIKELGIPTCLICWDNLELPYKQKKIAPVFDVVWITSWETRYLFESWGCKNIIFKTYAANPYHFVPKWNEPIYTVGFIGSPYGSRINKLNDLLHAGICCQVYSNTLFQKGYNTSVGDIHRFDIVDVLMKISRYMRFPIGRKVLMSTIRNKFLAQTELDINSRNLKKKYSVSDDDMISLYSNMALSLNITELRDTYICKHPIHKIHLRTFEIPMSGGLELASYTEELASYFEEDKEIVLYRSKEEMIDKARFYLNPKNETIVTRMKLAARKRAENEHRWIDRFEYVFKALGMNNAKNRM